MDLLLRCLKDEQQAIHGSSSTLPDKESTCFTSGVSSVKVTNTMRRSHCTVQSISVTLKLDYKVLSLVTY
jgi:hypothetical protein